MTTILYVYILLCSDGTYYVGVTNNIHRRVKEHNEGNDETCYTFSGRPCELMYWETKKYPHEAIAREKQIKKWGRSKKIALINGDVNQLHELSKCNNSTSHKLKGK